MRIELMVALIALSTSLIVAIISLITSIITNRHSARSEQTIERLKHDLSRIASKEDANDIYIDKSLEALYESIKTLQVAKDAIQVVNWSIEPGINSPEALKLINQARKGLFECYEEHFAYLDEWDAGILHKSKNMVFNIENIITKRLQDKNKTSSLSEIDRRSLERLREELTEAQQLLRDSRTEKLARRINHGNQNFS